MNKDRNQQQPTQSRPGQPTNDQQEQKHPSPFKDATAGTDGDETNTQEEASWNKSERKQ